MKLSLVIMMSLLAFGFAHADNNNQHGKGGGRGSSGGGHAPAPRAAPSFSFPKYNRPAPAPAHHVNMPATHGEPNHEPPHVNNVPVHHDSLGNHVTDDHMHRVDFANHRVEDVMRNNPHVTDVVHIGRTHYANTFRPRFEEKRIVFNEMINRYNHFIVGSPLIVDTWHRHGFYGGFYWGFHPVLDIDTYFYNPSVYWFYVGNFDEPYYRSWYQDRYDAYPQFHKPFEFHGVYYPTDNLRQLLFGVSAMPSEKQAMFRDAITIFTQRIAQNMANGLGARVTLTQGDVVVTHYEIIGYDDAVVLEGMVNHNNNAYNFRGLVDLENPAQTQVFVPATWDKNPTPQQLSELDQINGRVAAMKGEPPPTGETMSPDMLVPPPPPAGAATA